MPEVDEYEALVAAFQRNSELLKYELTQGMLDMMHGPRLGITRGTGPRQYTVRRYAVDDFLRSLDETELRQVLSDLIDRLIEDDSWYLEDMDVPTLLETHYA